MIERPFVIRKEWLQHVDSDWRTVHDIWEHVKNYVPGHGYSKAEVDAMWEGYNGTRGQVAWVNVLKAGSNLTDLATRQHAGLTNVTSGQHHAQLHGASHHSGGGDAVKLDNLATPDDNTDLDFSTARHGLVPKGTDVGDFLRDDGTWAAAGGGAGDVTAAANLADNTIIRGDGGAKGIQDSGITIDDSDNISGVGTISSGSINVSGAVAQYVQVDSDSTARFIADAHDDDAFIDFQEDNVTKWTAGFDFNDSLKFMISEGPPGTTPRVIIFPSGMGILVGGDGVVAGETWNANAEWGIENNDHAIFEIMTPTDKIGGIMFSDPDASGRGYIRYSHVDDSLQFHTAATLALTISSAQLATFAGAINAPEIYNSGGDLKIQPDVQGDVVYFGDTDVADNADGKAIIAHRKAAEGDSYIKVYINQYLYPVIDFGGSIADGLFIGKDCGAAITTGLRNYCMGFESGTALTTETGNTFIGFRAGQNATSANTVAIGNQAGRDNQGTLNVFIGEAAGMVGTSAESNVFVGAWAGYSNTTADYNVFIGTEAGYSNLGGISNTFVGRRAGQDNTSGRDNTFIGNATGMNNTTLGYNTVVGSAAFLISTASTNCTVLGYYAHGFGTGDYNTMLGTEAGYSTGAGGHAVYIGRRAGYTNTGGMNVCIGSSAGFNGDGSYNIFLGYNSGYNEAGSYKLYIAVSNTATPLIYGDFSAGYITINGYLNVTTMKSGATQVAAGAVANELWYTSGHASLPNNVVMMGV